MTLCGICAARVSAIIVPIGFRPLKQFSSPCLSRLLELRRGGESEKPAIDRTVCRGRRGGLTPVLARNGYYQVTHPGTKAEAVQRMREDYHQFLAAPGNPTVRVDTAPDRLKS